MFKLLIGFFILSSQTSFAMQAFDLGSQPVENFTTTLDQHTSSCNNQIEASLKDRFPLKIAELQAALASDDTDSLGYELRRFSCHDYAKRLYLQNSSKVQSLEPYNLDNLSESWGGIEVKPADKKFNMHYLTVHSAEEGYFHAINAVLIDESNPESIDSYIFIEPQTDKLLEAGEIRDHSSRLMRKPIEKPITVELRTFDSYKFNGNIWQSHSTKDKAFIIN
tara:strand:+ start:1831 stop:2496 length:666 start_codon:yes stop_codon:yes gene_type:complete